MTKDEETFQRRTAAITRLSDAIRSETSTICLTMFILTVVLLIGFITYTNITRDNIKCDEVLNKLNNLTVPEYFLLKPLPKENVRP